MMVIMDSSQPRSHGHDASAVSIHDDGFDLFQGHTIVDVFFDGQRIWSVAPASQGQPLGDETVRVRWPKPLRRFLHGVTRITLREHATGDLLLDHEHQFGTSVERVSVADREGRPLAVDKIGHLERPFDSSDDRVLASLLDQVQEILRILREECALSAFIAFGALLGAVREGKLLGHDNDIDISYLSKYQHPLDVGRESFEIQRAMRRHGFEVRRFSAADFKVRFTVADGSVEAVDIFGGFRCEELLYIMPRLRVPLRDADIQPTRDVELEGRSLPGPAQPEKFLAVAYGEKWRVPDPTWRPRPDPYARRRMDGWTRGLRAHRDYWEGYYLRKNREEATEAVSDFARWVIDREKVPAHIVDIGSGSARDALAFAYAGHRVTALDYAYSAVTGGNRSVAAAGLPVNVEFFNLYETRQVLATGARLAHADEPCVLYGRLIMNALEKDGRENFWRLTNMALRRGGRLYLALLTRAESESANGQGRHLRPRDPGPVIEEIQSQGGSVMHWEHEHPVRIPPIGQSSVSWLVAQW